MEMLEFLEVVAIAFVCWLVVRLTKVIGRTKFQYVQRAKAEVALLRVCRDLDEGIANLGDEYSEFLDVVPESCRFKELAQEMQLEYKAKRKALERTAARELARVRDSLTENDVEWINLRLEYHAFLYPAIGLIPPVK